METKYYEPAAMIQDFPLEKFMTGMSEEQKQHFCKGFTKCYSTFISAIDRNNRLFLSSENVEMLEHFTGLMIEVIDNKTDES